MSVIHHTTMVPTKLELLSSWLPSRPWYSSRVVGPELVKAGGFRLDDPEGEVGIEFMAVRDGDATYHVPMTYRAAPLEHEDGLIGTSEHGVLGQRWIYDGTRDPVFVAQLVALLNGKAVPQAQSVSDTPDPTVTTSFRGPVLAASALRVADTADATEILLADATLRVNRVLRAGSVAPGHVTAGWSEPDGTRAHGSFVTVR